MVNETTLMLLKIFAYLTDGFDRKLVGRMHVSMKRGLYFGKLMWIHDVIRVLNFQMNYATGLVILHSLSTDFRV